MTRRSALALLPAAALAQKRAVRPPKPSGGPYSGGVWAGDLFHVSGHVGPEPGGGFAPFDIKTQTRRCLDLVGKVLAEAGLDQRHVVSTTLYLTDIRTLDAADAAYREVYTAPYPARVEIESHLLIPEALSEVSAVAVRDPAMKKAVSPEGWPEPKRPVSHAMDAGAALYLSALRPVDPRTGQPVGSTIAGQTAQVMRNRDAMLAAAGWKPSDLSGSRVFLADDSHRAGFEAAWRNSTREPLAALRMEPVESGHLLQVQTIARRGPGKVLTATADGRKPGGGYDRNDIKAQTRQMLANLQAEFARGGLSLADGVDAVVFVRDARHAGAMNEVYREIVKPDPPARATVRLASMEPDALIRILMIAAK